MLWQNRMRRAILMFGSGGGQHELANTQPGQPQPQVRHQEWIGFADGSRSSRASRLGGVDPPVPVIDQRRAIERGPLVDQCGVALRQLAGTGDRVRHGFEPDGRRVARVHLGAVSAVNLDARRMPRSASRRGKHGHRQAGDRRYKVDRFPGGLAHAAPASRARSPILAIVRCEILWPGSAISALISINSEIPRPLQSPLGSSSHRGIPRALELLIVASVARRCAATAVDQGLSVGGGFC